MTADRRKSAGFGSMARPIERDKNSKAAFRRLLGYLRPYRREVSVSGLLIAVSSVLTMVAPWLQGVTIDEFIAAGDRGGLGRMIVVLVAVYISAWATATLFGRLVAKTAQLAMADIRQHVFARMRTLSMRFFDRTSTGDVMSRVTNDVDAIDQLLSQNLSTIVGSVVQVLAMLTIMVVLDWRMMIAAVLPVPIVWFVARKIAKLSQPAFNRYQGLVGSMNGLAEEDLSAQRSVIALGQQERAKAKFKAENLKARSAGIRAQTLTRVMLPIIFGAGSLSAVSVIGVGAWLAISSETSGVTVGLITTFLIYSGRISRPLVSIANTITSIFVALSGVHRVFEFLDEEPDIVDIENPIVFPPAQGWVDFEEAEFSYVENTPALSDLTFTAEPGQTIGLVGPTGAGKSTIINLLCRFYDLDYGSISVDDSDVVDISRDSLRHQIAVVPQHTFLFSETVRENIRFGRLTASDEEVEEVARLMNADGFIRALPHGYDTAVFEGGANLSAGQRQLIALARAALSNPRLLILDEATSSVDTRTEQAIQVALLRLMEGRTSFVIAHRLATVRDADQILVIENGMISEQGTHDQLLALGGFYAAAHEAQFRGRANGADSEPQLVENVYPEAEAQPLHITTMNGKPSSYDPPNESEGEVFVPPTA